MRVKYYNEYRVIVGGDRERRISMDGMGYPSLLQQFNKYSIKILNLKKIYIYFHHTWIGWEHVPQNLMGLRKNAQLLLHSLSLLIT